MRNFFPDVKPEDARAAIRVGLSVGVPLYAIYLCDRLDLGVFAAFGALTSLYGHSEPAHHRLETQVAVGAALVTTIAAAALFAAAHGPEWLLALMLFTVVLSAGTLGTVMKWVPRGEIFFVLSLLVIAGLPLKPQDFPIIVVTSMGGASISVLLTRLEAKRTSLLARDIKHRALTGASEVDKRRHSIAILIAAIGVVVAWLLSLALHIAHPYWAALIVTALMPALLAADAVRRTTRLMLGTSGGVGLAALVFSTAPGPLTLISLIILCQALAEIFVARSYAVALLFFTPLAIGMSNLGGNLPWAPLLIARVVEAGIGTTVALIFIAVGRGILMKLTPQVAPE